MAKNRAELLHLAEEVFHRRAGCLRDTHQVAQQLVGSLERDVELRHLCVKSRHRGAHVHISDAGEVEEQARSRLELVAGRPEERIDVRYRTGDHLGRLRDGTQDVGRLGLEVLEGLAGRAGALDEDVFHCLEVEARLDERCTQAGRDADTGHLEAIERLRCTLRELADVLLGLAEFLLEVLRVGGKRDRDFGRFGGHYVSPAFWSRSAVCFS